MHASDDRSPASRRNEPGGDARAARLAAIRAAIARGDYETTERLEPAVERLFAAIGRDD